MKKMTLLTAVLTLSASIASADLMYSEGGTATETSGYGDSGVSFQVTQDISVTHLGFYALSLGGADVPYAQLWNVDTNTVLGSVSWTQPETTNDDWNYKALSSAVTLTTGVNYQVQGMAWWVPTYADASGFSYGADITGVSFKHNGGFAGWTPAASPSTGTPGEIATMVNLQYNAIPEPSTWIMMFSGMGLLLVTLRRRK
ncbi:PEP-CTERM sorting domain-containing protein [Kiritimatiellaeota bacterium B1221]|nr:PEP-CTERM sorting domain-containing protein [Kiritimatiellaeota bacterium B1221]